MVSIFVLYNYLIVIPVMSFISSMNEISSLVLPMLNGVYGFNVSLLYCCPISPCLKDIIFYLLSIPVI